MFQIREMQRTKLPMEDPRKIQILNIVMLLTCAHPVDLPRLSYQS